MKAPWWVETSRMLIICASNSFSLSRRNWRISSSLSWQKWADTKNLTVSSCSYHIPLLSEMFTSMTMFGRCILDTGGNRLFFQLRIVIHNCTLSPQGWHLPYTFLAETFQAAKAHWRKVESQRSTRRKLTNSGQCQGQPLSAPFIPTSHSIHHKWSF